jgi:hypothetical protein
MTLTKRLFPMLLVGAAVLTITGFAGSTLFTLGKIIQNPLDAATRQVSGLQPSQR